MASWELGLSGEVVFKQDICVYIIYIYIYICILYFSHLRLEI